jgi:hypothetical protein
MGLSAMGSLSVSLLQINLHIFPETKPATEIPSKHVSNTKALDTCASKHITIHY